MSKFKDPGYYKGNYAFGPGTNWGELLGYLNQNMSSFTLDPSSVGVNAGNFDLVEQVSAGYVMDTIDFNKVRIVAGLRIEGTSLFTSTPAFSDCPSSPQGCTPPINPVTGYAGNINKNGSYINYLPSVSAKIDLGHDTNLRLSIAVPFLVRIRRILLRHIPLQLTQGNHTENLLAIRTSRPKQQIITMFLSNII